MSIEAMKLALEALEHAPGGCGFMWQLKANDAINALRAALSQQPATGEPAAFDPVAEGGRIVASSARKSANDDNWRKLFWELAKLLNCLPSSFVDGNEHVLKKAQELQAHAAK